MIKAVSYLFALLCFYSCKEKKSTQLFDESVTKNQNIIKLPPPQKTIGKPLMLTLNLRKTSREFSSQLIPLQELSNLLWAAFGINRQDGKRTAPSAWNWQEIKIYVSSGYGLYYYNAKEHSLERIISEDIRSITGVYKFVEEAPISLVYIADFSKIGPDQERDETKKILLTSADAGFIIQNVYLYCASEGLGTVVYAGIDKEAFAKKLNLNEDQKIVLGQTIGYTKK